MKSKSSIALMTLLAALWFTSTLTRGQAHDHDHDHQDHAVTTKPSSSEPSTDHAGDAHGHGKQAGHTEHTDEVRLTAEAVKRYGIKVEAVRLSQLTDTMTSPARVAFNTDAMAHVGSAVKGRATQIKARVGDRVKKGDELLVVESPELGEAQSDYLQKRTAVTVAESAVAPTKSGIERARKLYDQNQGIALAELQKREAEFKAAEGALQTAQAAATAAENKLHLLGMDKPAVKALTQTSEIDPKFVIRAPIDGQLIEREVTLGELVSPEKEALMILADTQSIWVIADVPENKLKHVKIDADVLLRIQAAQDEPVRGKVSLISPSLDSATRTGQVRIEVPNLDGNLRPGMFATAEIASAGGAVGQAGLAVPEEAVQTVEGALSVFVPVAGEENTFAKRNVTAGATIGGMRLITAGVKEGEQIVVHGTFILKAELGKGSAAHEH